MIATFHLVVAFAAAVIASPLSIRNNNGPPSVTIKNGTVVGRTNTLYGQQEFLGIPFADPPERLARSSPLSTSFGTLQATKYGPHCWSRVPANGFDDNSGFENSEDCLTLNVVRPYGVYEGQSKVPVVLWLHGGGLTTGGSADYRYNASGFVDASVSNGHPIVFVSANYRLASFGFLASSELKESNALNLGFLDQRLAMHWVQENIGAFGGDASKVTIMGESAGGSSVFAHVFAYGGRDDGLFSQAVVSSGTGFSPYTLPNATRYQTTYDSLIVNTTCSSTAQSSVEKQLECIRGLDVQVFRNATAAGSTGPARDGSLIQEYSPVTAINSGKWVKVPFLLGNNRDEGVSFSVSGANTTEQRRAALASIPDANIDEILSLYPDDPKVGCPFNTGDYQLDPFQNGGYRVPGKYNKQVAAISGDLSQWVGPRWLAQTISKTVPFYKYVFDHIPYTIAYGTADYVGHFVDVAYTMNTQNNDTDFWIENHFTATYLGPGANINDRALGEYMSRAWTSFIATGTPNNANFSAAPTWPKYSENAEQIYLRIKGSTIQPDDERKEGLQYMIENIVKTSV